MATLMLGKEGIDTLRSTNPAFRLREVDQTAPAGMWQIDAEGGDLLFQASTNDTWTAFTPVVTMTSTPSITVHGTITFSGTVVFSANVRLDDDIVILFGDGSDYYMGYSATADEVQIGTGSTVNSNVSIVVGATGLSGIRGDLEIGTGVGADIGEIFGNSDSSTGGLRLSGGNTKSNGAHIVMYGGSHATVASDAYIDADNFKLRAQNGSTIYMSMDMEGAGAGELYLSSLGSDTGTALLITGSNEVVKDSSSIAYKDNVQPLDSDSNRVFDLNPVTFNWKRNGSPDFGLIAEDVAEAMPEMVTYNKDGEPQAVRYDRLSVFLLLELAKIKTKLEVALP